MPRKKATAKSKPANEVVVRESYDAFDYGYDDLRDRYGYTVSQLGSRRPYWMSAIEDRAEGKWLPIYETEWELAEIRAKGRGLASCVSMAIGAQSALANYIFGNGFTFKVNSEDESNKKLVEEVQTFVDKIIDDNDFITGDQPGLDREIHDRSREDGESIVALYVDEVGDSVRIRQIDSSQLTEPRNARELEDWLYSRGMLQDEVSYWKFGVHTRLDPVMNCEDLDNPLGYHVVYDTLGNNWDYLPANQVVHLKRNVGRNAKRGVSDYYAVWRMIEREEKLVTNVAEGAAVQAAIAFIRQHAEGKTKDGITRMVAENSTSDHDIQTKSGPRNRKRETFYPGTVKDIPAGMEYLYGPMGTPGHKIFVEVAQLLMRVCGVRWNMPEALISSDASNANFSSSLVAEAPFVKAREADQQVYKGNARAIVWKSIRLAFDKGRFNKHGLDWEAFEDAIEVKVEAPSVASRDGLKAAQEADILSKAGILSPRTWATQANLDYDNEIKQGAEKEVPLVPVGPDGKPIVPSNNANDPKNPDAKNPVAKKPNPKDEVAESEGGGATRARPFVIQRVPDDDYLAETSSVNG